MPHSFEMISPETNIAESRQIAFVVCVADSAVSYRRILQSEMNFRRDFDGRGNSGVRKG